MRRTEFERILQQFLTAREHACQSLTDEQALDCIALYPAWAVSAAYAVGTRVRYEDHLYTCVQAHTSQSTWTPADTPALWTEVAPPGVIPVWKQPTGAQDAYHRGDKVHYPDESSPVYESTVDSNVWAPDVYPAGWQLVA